ncbi:MAG: lysophospholipid acyltransferase family protein [Candidatus Helarchaeota archaeon]
MSFKLKDLMPTRKIIESEEEIFYIFNVKMVKTIIEIFKFFRLYSFFPKIPKSFLKFLAQGVSHVVIKDETYNQPIIKFIKKILGKKINEKYPGREKYIINRILFHNFIKMFEFFFEIILLMPHFNMYRQIAEYVKIKGRNYLDNALKKGNGVIIVSDHIDNYLLFLMFLALSGYKVNIIMQIQSYTSILKILKESGLKIIPSPPSGNEKLRIKIRNLIEKVLNNNEILIILQDFGSQHYKIMDFFDELCYTPIGVVSLALKYNSPILIAFFKSNKKKYRYEITITPEFKIERNSDKKADIILHNTYNINKIIEKHIKRNIIDWMIIPVYYNNRIYKIGDIKDEGSLVKKILNKIQFYENLINKSYEPRRDSKKIILVLNKMKEELKRLE